MTLHIPACARTMFRGVLAVTLALTVAVPAFAARQDYLLVGNQGGDGNILRFDLASGAFIDELVPKGRGGLRNVQSMAIGPDGNLYVGNGPFYDHAKPWVSKFNARTGKYMGLFASGVDMNGPFGITFGPDGNMYVSDNDNKVLRFDGTTGASMGVFASVEAPGNAFRGSTWGADGNLYVAQVWGGVARFDGHTGALIDTLAVAQTGNPESPTFGPDGLLYLGDYFAGKVDVYDPTSGEFVRSLSNPSLSGLTTLAFDDQGHLYATAYFSNAVVRFSGDTGSVFSQGDPLTGPIGMVMTSVPEPATTALFVAGCAALGLVRERRRMICHIQPTGGLERPS